MNTKTSREKIVLVFHSSNRSSWHEMFADAEVPIKAIAAKCGWQSSARLRVFFHETEGVSMRAWRAAHAR